jgi:hypothetical protein
MQFKTNDMLIKQVKACVNAFGICYYHGDGNMYDNEKDSHFRKTFGNPGQEESKYRVIFKRGDKIPGTVKEMNDMLLESRNRERLQESIPKEVHTTKTLQMSTESDEEEAEEVVVKKGNKKAQAQD